MDSNIVRSSRKRKHCADVEGGGEDDDEETKMEKFFGLIQSLREARERVMMDRNGWASWLADKNHNKSMKNKQVMMKGCVPVPVPAWEPRFQLEDFAQEAKDLVGVAFNNTGKAPLDDHQKQKAAPGQGLDLRLSL